MTQVAIIGAGPYGLSVAAHLRARNISYRIFGPPLETWRAHMPAGMLLKSDGFASNLSAPDKASTLAAYCAAHGEPYHDTDIPVSLDLFNAYALDFQRRHVPDLDHRKVVELDRDSDAFALRLDDGEIIRAATLVMAVGITHFAQMPAILKALPAALRSHSSDHHGLHGFAGRRVTVVGGGASAVDIAALLHEAGAHTSLITRGPSLRFSSPPQAGGRSLWQRLRHPSSGIGPGLRSWLCQNCPGLFRFLPGPARLFIIKHHLGPKSAWGMKARLEIGVSIYLGQNITAAHAEGDKVRLTLRGNDGCEQDMVTDHVVAATGYRPTIDALSFVSEPLRRAIRTHAHMPIVSFTFESAVPGLYVIGPAAVNSMGPLMRFMVGAEYAAPVVARHLARKVPTVQALGVVARA